MGLAGWMDVEFEHPALIPRKETPAYEIRRPPSSTLNNNGTANSGESETSELRATLC